MNLKNFHIFFILVCSTLGIFLGYIGFTENALYLMITGGALLLALVPYGIWFLKKTATLSVFILISLSTLLWTHSLLACPMCYSETSLSGANPIQAAKIGIIFLGSIIVSILVAIASIGWSWAKRARALDIQP